VVTDDTTVSYSATKVGVIIETLQTGKIPISSAGPTVSATITTKPSTTLASEKYIDEDDNEVDTVTTA